MTRAGGERHGHARGDVTTSRCCPTHRVTSGMSAGAMSPASATTSGTAASARPTTSDAPGAAQPTGAVSGVAGRSLVQYRHFVAANGMSLDKHAGHVFIGAGSPNTVVPLRAMIILYGTTMVK